MRFARLKLGSTIFRFLLHPLVRWLSIAAVVWFLYAALSGVGYPWWLWLPACFLAAVATFWVWLMIAYAYQKITYPMRARGYKRLREERRRSGES